ncbi:MAG: DUF5916 domain-containing protein [Bacteroidia bacterium]|nr:DUF5916 domain-containing protein [Bacteroidia bacterium]
MKTSFSFFFFGLMAMASLFGQNNSESGSVSHLQENTQGGNIFIRRATGKIALDGQLDEPDWFQGKAAQQFWQHFPSDTVNARGQTEVYMTYDDEFLYVGAKCISFDDHYITQSLKRDYTFNGSDNISILFDTYGDRTNAFLFGMNAFGVMREALIANGGREFDDFSESWDNKWFGEAKIHGDYWIAEMAIPFKTLRFKDGNDRWRFNSYRVDTDFNEITTWVQIPRNQVIMDLGFMREMVFEEPLQKPGKNISLIPYLTGGLTRDYENTEQHKPDLLSGVGGDAKIALTSALNLDLTINPDFSQVEVDQQVTNLQRFEIFFPERRQFFLENADLFSDFGQTRVNPFFSRRIGVAVDTATGQNIQNPILYGARLSGKLNDNLRVGVLNMQTASEPENGLPGFNFTVATLQQRIFSRSNLSFIFANKQAINAGEYSGDFNRYNRVAGLEYRIGSANNRWKGKLFYHQAFTTADEKDKYTHGVQLEYLKRRYRLEWSHIFLGNGFDAEMGYVQRRDIFLLSPEAQVYFYPSKGLLNVHSLALDYRMIFKPGRDGNVLLPVWGLSDRDVEVTWNLEFRDNTRGLVQLNNNYVFLLDDFDPTRVQDDSVFLPAGSAYTYTSISGNYTSDIRKKFSIEVTPVYGQFFNGTRAGVGGSFTYRYQPYGSVSLNYTYNHVELAAPFQPVDLWLFGPRIDITFTKSLFFTTFIQYNSQLNNLNINARFQWRFQPVSDFYIVFTDNYLTDPFSPFSVRNRAIVAKLTYWLNV